jgi:predicted DNA binding CopG/RHH family protein
MNIKGYYKENIQVRVERKVKDLIAKKARKKGMTVSGYIRALIYKDLGGELYGEVSDR